MTRMSQSIIGLFATLLIATSGSTNAATVSYVIEDLGDFTSYRTTNVGQSFAGTGFVGMEKDRFAHQFGLNRLRGSRTALQVDISAFAGQTIDSAYLEFVLKDAQGGTQDVTLTSFTADGTLEHLWDAPDNLGSNTFSVTSFGSNSLDVTSFLQDRITAAAGWFGLHLSGSSLSQLSYTWAKFGDTSDEAEVRLVVNSALGIPASPAIDAPEPTSMALFGLTALGMGMMRRRRKRNEDMTCASRF